MCGIAGIVSLTNDPIPEPHRGLAAMSHLLAHRGPDDSGTWVSADRRVGLAHQRLSIIDTSDAGHQPMRGHDGSQLVFNGMIYNYPELRRELAGAWDFISGSDTETILAAYAKTGEACLDDLRGMFAFALWDGDQLFCARDRFGIKPLYYTQVSDRFIFASEIKALLPFLPEIATDTQALTEYLVYQFTTGEQTMFKGVKQLLPGHALRVRNGSVHVWRYWDVQYEIDFDHTEAYFANRLEELLSDSLKVHLRSDVPIGAYLSGGIDSSLVALLSAKLHGHAAHAFHGKFTEFPGYDESHFAEAAARSSDATLHQLDITASQFADNIGNVIYHLDHPVAGPGSFPQYMVSGLAAQHVKVVLGGQGGDEVFGGYARYLIAYLEQCLRAAIDGSYRDGNFVVTIESIIPNLPVLREYQPLIQKLWSQGLFGPLDERYYRLIDRAATTIDEIDWSQLDREAVFQSFQQIFNNPANVGHTAYFDKMTHFDFKTLLPALLQVEDRMSMAHGLESRVPLLDHRLIEFAATVPADVKFKDGSMKHLLKVAYKGVLPQEILQRRDKMGFPVPLKEWMQGELKGFFHDTFRSVRAQGRPMVNADAVLAALDNPSQFGRKIWALLSLEMWQQQFHDRADYYRHLPETLKIQPEDTTA